jgi:hypothetical protein
VRLQATPEGQATNQNFDPAVVRVLETFGRMLSRVPGDAIDADKLTGLLAAEGDPVGAELARDRLSLRGILDQLCADGLLEIVSSDTGAPPERYRLTPLGRARLKEPDEEE